MTTHRKRPPARTEGQEIGPARRSEHSVPAGGDNGPPAGPEVVAMAERQLLGCVLWSAHAGARLSHLAEMISGLAVDDLTDPEIRRVLETIRLLIGDGKVPIPAVIVPAMVDAGLLPEQLGTVATGLVCDLIGEAPAVVMWPELKATIKEWSVRRRVAQSGVRLREAAGRSPDLDDLRRLVASEADAARDALAVVA